MQVGVTSEVKAEVEKKRKNEVRECGADENKNNLQMVVCCCSVAKSCPTLCNPVDCGTPGFPVLHCLMEFA